MLFYLVHNGVAHELVWGYHTGWDFDRLVRMFTYLKKRENSEHVRMALSVALGAGAVMSKKGAAELKRVAKEVSADEGPKKGSGSNLADQMGKLASLISGVGWENGEGI